MSINPELMLIAKVLESGDLKAALDSGLEAEHFVDDTCGEQYHYLVEYYTSPDHPRSVPTVDLFKESFPTAVLPEVDKRTTVEELVAASKNKQLALVCKQMSDELAYMAEGGSPLSALESAISTASGAVGRSRRTRDIMLSTFADRLIEDYKGAKDGRMRGVPWPWQPLNEVTRGIEDENFILIYGRPKNMKTWVATYIGTHFYQTNNRGGRVLFLTLEMSPEQIARRTAALLTGVDYEQFQKGRLPRDDEDLVLSYLPELAAVEKADMHEGRKREFIIASPEQDISVIEVENKIESYAPDIVIIDGIYMLADARTKKSGVDWATLANVSRDLKRLAKRKRVPIIGVHQANRMKDTESDDMEDIAMSDNFGRDPDVIIKCIQIESFNMGSVIALLFSGAREFKMAGFYIHGKPAKNFEYIQQFATKDELLAYVKKSKSTHEKAAGSPTNMPNLGNVMNKLEGRFGKKS